MEVGVNDGCWVWLMDGANCLNRKETSGVVAGQLNLFKGDATTLLWLMMLLCGREWFNTSL